MGSSHARAAAGDPSIEIAVVADQTADLAESLALEVGAAPMSFRDFAERTDIGVDGIVVASSTDSHDEVLTAMLQRKVPILCEKPLSSRLDTSERCLNAIGAAGGQVTVGLMRRFDPALLQARAMLKAGTIGSARSIRIVTHDEALPDPVYAAHAGHIFGDMMIHDFDLVHWLLQAPIEWIVATGSHFPPRTHGADPDVAMTSFRTQTGVSGSIACSRHDPDGYRFELYVHGDRGSLALSDLGPIGRPVCRTARERFAAAYTTQIQSFARSCSYSLPLEGATAYDAHLAFVVAEHANRAWLGGASEPVNLKEMECQLR